MGPAPREPSTGSTCVIAHCQHGTEFEKVTLTGRSNESFEDAVGDAIGRAEQTLDNLVWVPMESQAVELDRAEREYQAEVEVAFELEADVGE